MPLKNERALNKDDDAHVLVALQIFVISVVKDVVVEKNPTVTNEAGMYNFLPIK